MSFIPTVNSIKVVIIGSLFGQQIVIDITVGKSSAITVTDLENVAPEMRDWWNDELAPQVVNDYTINNVKAYDMSSSTAPVYDFPCSEAGDLTDTACANNVAAAISFRTANRGRTSRGRIYIGGLPVNPASGVVMTGTTQAALAVAGFNINDYLTPLSLFHTVVSLYSNGSPRTSGLAQPTINYVVNSDYDSQRRRLQGRGA